MLQGQKVHSNKSAGSYRAICSTSGSEQGCNHSSIISESAGSILHVVPDTIVARRQGGSKFDFSGVLRQTVDT